MSGAMTRQLRAAEVARLKAEGLNGIEIAERMGISRSYAYELLSDPGGAADRARKASYGGRCENCGGTTDGSNGTAAAPPLCDKCRKAQQNAEAKGRHLEAVREFVRRYGEPPSATDWNPPHARSVGHPEKAERFYRDGCYPHLNAVQSVWGSWRALLTAAGYPGRRIRRGRPGDDPDVVAETVRLYVDECLSGAEVGARMGVSATAVYRRLEVAGAERRPRRREAEAAA